MKKISNILSLVIMFGFATEASARYYEPSTARFLSEDPLYTPGESPYVYANNNPLIYTDPLGLDAIYINYDYYPVHVGGSLRLPLGHAGVVAVDPNTGFTRYFEYGRYDPANLGTVRSFPIPDLVMGENGLPTQGSLNNLYSFLSRSAGRGANVSATYYPEYSFAGTLGYSMHFQRNLDRSKYNIFTNNCKTFAQSAATACLENQACPWIR